MDQRFAGFFQRARRIHPLGLAGDFSKAEQRSIGVVNRVDDDVGKELRAVLADPPALFLEPSIPRRNLSARLRQAGLFGSV